MENKLQNLLSEIAAVSDEDVKTLFLKVSKFPAINASLLAKMQDMLANTFEDAKTTISGSLQPPKRSVRLSTKPLILTHAEEMESRKEDGVSSEHVHKIDNDINYSVESETEDEEKEDHRKPLQPKANR